MAAKLSAAAAVLLIAVVLFSGCIFGGDDGGPDSVTRSGVAPTATMPSTLPEPIELGSSDVATTTNTTAANGNTYTVVSGDTLFGIAAKLGVAQEQQAAWTAEVLRLNGVPDASLLAAGVVLRLPVLPTPTGGPASTATPSITGTPRPTATSTPGPATTPSATATSVVTGSGDTYTVVDGDYPLLIAQKLGAGNPTLYAQQIVALNGIDAGNLQVGQVLQLPPLN